MSPEQEEAIVRGFEDAYEADIQGRYDARHGEVLRSVTLPGEDWDLLTDLIVHEQEILDQKESLAGLGDQAIEQAQIRLDGILSVIRPTPEEDLACQTPDCRHDAEAADRYDFLMLIAPEDRTDEQEQFVTHMGAILSAEVAP